MPSSDRGDEQDEQRQPLIADDEYHGNPARRRHHGESDSPRSVMHSVELSNGRRKPLKATEKMWVIATTSLISFLAFSSQFFVLIPYWLDTPGVTWSQILLCLLPFNIGVAAIFYNYYLVVFTNPGSVPAGWEPEWDAIAGVEVKASTGQPRYCKVCRSYKPPRAHHCRTCKRCVLRMDHHCPWVANCVGHGNYGHFLRFLYSVNFTMSIHVTLLCLRVADWWSPMVLWREPTTTDMVLMILNFAQGLPVLLMVGIFSMYHTYALCTNTTTIESWEKDKVATLIRRGKIEEIKFPYDLGMKKNIQSVLGRRMLFWCWPGAKPMGNGMDYSPGEGNDWRDQFYWPPKDPTRSGGRRVHRRHGPGSAPADGSSSQQYRVHMEGPFTYGGNGFNPALIPSNSARLQAVGNQGEQLQPEQRAQGDTLRRRLSSRSTSPQQVAPTVQDGDNVDGYHPTDQKERRGSVSSQESSASSSAEEAGVVDGGCIPAARNLPGVSRWRGQSDDQGDDKARRRRRAAKKKAVANNEDEDSPEEHELLAARESRKWDHTSQRKETFPRLWAEEDSASEDSELGSEGHDSSSDDDDKPIASLGQLRSKIRRGSEGYEVKPMMYDQAYAAQLADEEERLREFLMAERERLGTNGAQEYYERYGGAGHEEYLPEDEYSHLRNGDHQQQQRQMLGHDGGDNDGADPWGDQS